MEARKPEMAQFGPAIKEFTDKGCSDEVLKLVKEDFELGYPKELVALYAEAGWQMDRCKKFSSIMRVNSDGELLRMLAGGGFNQYQMQLLANYYDKGLTVPQLADVGAKKLPAYDMEQALKLVYQANKEAGEVPESGETEEKAPQENDNSMQEALRQREKELEEQQEISNKRAAENAELRNKTEELEKRAGELEKQVKELEQEKAGYGSEKKSILEERDRFYRQNQTLLGEKEQLIADIEAVQKEKDGLEQRLKEMEEMAVAGTKTEPQATAAQHPANGQQTINPQTSAGAGQRVMEETSARTEVPERPLAGQQDKTGGGMGNHDFTAAIKGRNGEMHLIPVERTVRRKPDGIRAFAEKILGRGGQSSELIKQLTGKGLNPAQMEQVRIAVQAGLTEQEVNDLIDSGFSAEEMAQAVGIVLAERNYQ